MKLMIEGSIKMCLYKIYFINKHVPSHVDDKVFKTNQIKFSVISMKNIQPLEYNILATNDQNASQNHNHIVVNLNVLITVWSVFFQVESSIFRFIYILHFIICMEL